MKPNHRIIDISVLKCIIGLALALSVYCANGRAQAPNLNLDSLISTLDDQTVIDSIKVKNMTIISMILAEKTLLDSALRVSQRALDKSIAIGYVSGIEQLPMVTGHILNLKGDQVAAIELYTREIARHRNSPKTSVLGLLYLNQSSIYMDIEDFKLAEISLLKAQEYLTSTEDSLDRIERNSIAVLNNNLGLCNHKLGSYPEALTYFMRAKELAGEDLISLVGPRLYPNMANTYIELGDNEQADKYFDLALEIIQPANIYSKTFTYTNLAGYKERQGLLQEADALCDSVLQYNHIEEVHGFLPELYKIKYNVAKEEGRLADALGFHEKFVIAQDSMIGIEKKLEFTRKEMGLQAQLAQRVTELEHRSQIQQQEHENKQSQLLSAGIIGGIILLGAGAWLFFSNRKKLAFEKLARQSADNELKALRAQMNPHFNSNALNAVITKVRNDEPEEAINYLTRISRLMDGVLKNSDLSVNSLEDELDLLADYIALQKARYSNRFDYQVEMSDELEIDEIYIPSLILQPYIENSLEHGISELTDGKIKIEIIQKGFNLKVLISDNGIGHNNHVSNGSARGRESMGTRITRERIELFNKVHKTDGGVRYLEVAQGTKVEITLPIVDPVI